ncbi:MAG: putative DNA binding domain-containing protein [Lachnospiraceae bacterium]|nr:putative DNA binding domain-containing protein [Lachnospiraceae bacterium]
MNRINIGPETETKEYKKSTGEMKEAMLSITAILNKHQKGELYFGVANDGTVIGQLITDETLRKISQAVQNHIRPAVYPDIRIVTYEDRQCIRVSFEGSQRPYLAYNIPRIRVADEDLVMDQNAYERMIQNRSQDVFFWERQVSDYTIDDVDPDSFAQYLRRAREAGRIDFKDEEIRTVLTRLELLEGDRLLNAGAALFCRTGINELQMAKFASNERLTFTDIRRDTGSIMELSRKAEQYIVDAMDWRAEISDSLWRKEIPEIPVRAIREAIINSFGHRLFGCGQSNEIAVFRNRIEIYNPGTFPEGLTPDIFIAGKSRPVRRNPLITRTLYYSKDMESFATGLKRIADDCREAGCRVEFQQSVYGFAVVFYRERDPSMSGNPQVASDNTQVIHNTPQVNRGNTQVIPENTQVSPRDTQVIPENTQVNHSNAQVNRGNTHAIPNDAQVNHYSTKDIPCDTQVSHHNTQAIHCDTQINHHSPQAIHCDTQVNPDTRQIPCYQSARPPLTVCENVSSYNSFTDSPAPVIYSRNDIPQQILTFCSVPRTKKEILSFLGCRSPKTLRPYLFPLLQTGQLTMTVPDKPNSRNQKYLAKK